MTQSTERVLQTALALSPAEQVELIEALVAAADEADPQPLDRGLDGGDSPPVGRI